MSNNLNNPNRYRVSSKYFIQKILIGIALLYLTYRWGKDVVNQTFTQSSVALILGTLFLGALLYFLTKIKTIEYDDVKCILYILDSTGKFETEIPVERIDKILYSSVGFGNGSYSYLIIYRDLFNQKQKVRLFPIPFSNHIRTIITDTRLRNPDVITRSRSIGWNELSD
jgi:hypothetical protein